MIILMIIVARRTGPTEQDLAGRLALLGAHVLERLLRDHLVLRSMFAVAA